MICRVEAPLNDSNIDTLARDVALGRDSTRSVRTGGTVMSLTSAPVKRPNGLAPTQREHDRCENTDPGDGDDLPREQAIAPFAAQPMEGP